VRLQTEGLFIKVSGVTTEDDALFSIGLGASAVGFDFGPTPRQISVNAAHDIVRRLPVGATSVGVFRNEMPQRIVEIANTLGLTAVQIDGVVSSEELSYVSERVNTVLRTLASTANHDLVKSLEGVDYVVVPESDDHYSLMDSLELFSDIEVRTPIIASGGLSPSNVVDIVQNYPVWGVDVRAGVEKSPGEKDPVLLGQFIANARWAFDNAYVTRHHEEWPM
jgi:phosphoribosylanthranilate isomerase